MDGERGSTFIEVSIAMLLVAIVTSSVFSVAITARQGGGRAMRRLIADQAARQLTERLKGYVTGDDSQTAIDWGFRGPSSGTTAAGNWTINGAAAINDDGTITDSMGNVNALSVGTHTLTSGVLPAWFSAPPYNASVRYVVRRMELFSGGAMDPTGGVANTETRSIPEVDVYVDWDEP
ncbi:MAG: hypothetical protein HY924_14085 [Elusimicrobia bacterium]|nr:hypothetical protein [Elusimicrobiota bacterium]